jgi:hypothetical protein
MQMCAETVVLRGSASMNRSHICRPQINSQLAPLSHTVAQTLMLASALMSLQAVHAVDVDPGDYAASPPGTNVLVQYLDYSRDNSINLQGAGDLPAHLNSEIGLMRAIHFTTLFGFTIDPQIIIPFGAVHDVQIDGQSENSSSGLGDPIVAATLWLVNQPHTSTYFGITPLITLPLGEYRRFDAINEGNDRLQGDIQLGFQTAFGDGGQARQVGVGLFADAIFSDANTRSAIPSHAGVTQATLTQATSYQLLSWLTYTTDDGTGVSVGYYSTMGGRQSLAGLPNGLRTEEQQVRFEVQKFVAKRWQLSGKLTHDVHVIGGFRQEVGVSGRILFSF